MTTWFNIQTLIKNLTLFTKNMNFSVWLTFNQGSAVESFGLAQSYTFGSIGNFTWRRFFYSPKRCGVTFAAKQPLQATQMVLELINCFYCNPSRFG